MQPHVLRTTKGYRVTSLLDAALDLAARGFSVVPVAADGSKRPAVDWKAYQETPPDRDDLDGWFDTLVARTAYDGLGVITGAVSGQLEMLEVEGRAAHLAGKLGETLVDAGFGDLWQRLSAGWLEVSPSGGLHWLYRVDGPARPNTKLARRRNPDNPRLVDVLLETRGEGGFVVTAPSAGRTHPTGKPWARIAGGPATCPTITVDERDTLYALAATLDEMPVLDHGTPKAAPGSFGFRPTTDQPGEVGDRPGDAYNARATWAEILEPAGWTVARRLGAGYAWTRPGKTHGISATTGQAADGVDRLYVFTTSTEFEAEQPYSKFGAYALLNHAGDHAAAASTLRKAGYGAPMPDRPALTLVGDTYTPDTTQAPAEHVDLFERAVLSKLYDLRVADEARNRLQIEKEGDQPPFDAGTLDEILQRPPEPPNRVEELIPTGAFTLIVAERKTGKTTLTLGLTRCLLTGDEFLGRFAVRPLTGRVAFLNYEVSAAQLARWARDAEIPHDRFVLVNLRGRRNPLAVPDDRAQLAAYLRSLDVETLIVDPFSRAFVGKSQNDAAEVQPWLLGLDQFARTEVGAVDVILTAHTGWGGERARGSSALEGHPDVTITMTRDDEKRARYLSAEGRDVMLDEDELTYDHVTRRLTLAGSGSRSANRAERKIAELTLAVIDVIGERPGLNITEIEAELHTRGITFRNGEPGRAAERAANTHHLQLVEKGRSKRYHPVISHSPHSPAFSPGERPVSSHPPYKGGIPDRDNPADGSSQQLNLDGAS